MNKKINSINPNFTRIKNTPGNAVSGLLLDKLGYIKNNPEALKLFIDLINYLTVGLNSKYPVFDNDDAQISWFGTDNLDKSGNNYVIYKTGVLQVLQELNGQFNLSDVEALLVACSQPYAFNIENQINYSDSVCQLLEKLEIQPDNQKLTHLTDNLGNCRITNLKLALQIFGKNLESADLSDLNIRGISLDEVNLFRANLYNTKLDQKQLIRAIQTGACLDGADLSGIDLRGLDLFWVSMGGANLTGARLDKQNILQAIEAGASLAGVDLSYQDMSGIDLPWDKLNGVNLKGTNLDIEQIAKAKSYGVINS